jgi:hypothetical protein
VKDEVVQGIRENPDPDGDEEYLVPDGVNTIRDCMEEFQAETVLDHSPYPLPLPKTRRGKKDCPPTHAKPLESGVLRRRGCASCGIRDLGVIDPQQNVASYTNSEYKWKTIPVDDLEQYALSDDEVEYLEASEYMNFYTFSLIDGELVLLIDYSRNILFSTSRICNHQA